MNGRPVQYRVRDGFLSMRTGEYVSYIRCRRTATRAAARPSDVGGGDTSSAVDPAFRYVGFDGVEREVDVLDTVLYLIDFDLMKLLPSLYDDMRGAFLLPGILPGGGHCMMNQVSDVV